MLRRINGTRVVRIEMKATINMEKLPEDIVRDCLKAFSIIGFKIKDQYPQGFPPKKWGGKLKTADLDQPFYASIPLRIKTREARPTPMIWIDGKFFTRPR
jgi:hypothetical protein